MKCQNCETEITFWMDLRQPTPFRFECSHCKARFRVSTPHMNAIVVGVILLTAGLTIGLIVGTVNLGIFFFAPFFALMIGFWLGLEVWAHRYMSANGRFTRIETSEPTGPDDASRPRP